MAYNITGIIDNSTGFLSLVQGVNTGIMFGYLGILILLIIFSVSLMAFLLGTDEAGKSFIAASFIAFGMSMLLRAVDLVPNIALFITLILLAGSIAFGLRNN